MSTYIFEKYSVSQQKNEYGIKKIITNFKTTTTGNLTATHIVPIWELDSDDITHINADKTDKTVVIGRVVTKITYGGDQDNESLTKMLRLVGTNNTNTPTTSMLTPTYTALANTIYGGTGLDTDSQLYKSNFYIGGQKYSSTKIKTFTKIFDLNKYFSSNNYFGLGLQINSALPSSTTLTVDTYVEVILVD